MSYLRIIYFSLPVILYLSRQRTVGHYVPITARTHQVDRQSVWLRIGQRDSNRLVFELVCAIGIGSFLVFSRAQGKIPN
jgi:hypothetical protein